MVQIPSALRHDGAPPLYYFMLHIWMLAFGHGDFAVRSLSGVLSVASIPLAQAAGRKLADRRVGYASTMLLSSSPFAIHYATAARMYSLLTLLSFLGLMALARALEQATFWRLAGVAVIAACLLYTHYWAMYLVVAAGVWLLVRATRPSRRAPADRRSSWLCLAAMVVGSLTFLLWLPVLVFQTGNTGTPWSNAAGVGDILTILGQYDGGGTEAAVYALAVFILLLLGVVGRNIGLRRQSDLQARTTGRQLAFVLAATLVLALAGAALAQTAVVSRYTAVVLPLYVVLAAGATACGVPERIPFKKARRLETTGATAPWRLGVPRRRDSLLHQHY